MMKRCLLFYLTIALGPEFMQYICNICYLKKLKTSSSARLLARLADSFVALCSQAPLRPADEDRLKL